MNVSFPEHEAMKAWERKVCEFLGVDLSAATGVRDNLGTLAEPKPASEPLRFWIKMIADHGMPGQAARGRWLGWDAEGSSEGVTVTAKVVLDWDDEREFMEQVGLRPALMSVETELMLRGLNQQIRTNPD